MIPYGKWRPVALRWVSHEALYTALTFFFNSLPDILRDPALSLNIFRRQLKTHVLRNIDEMYVAHYRFFENALYKLTLYLLTYLSRIL